MTEIEIRDPDPVQPDPASDAGDGSVSPESPYRNLLVPLVVVPALIAMVIVVVGGFVVAMVGRESSPRDNLERLLNGGMNERKQAAFALVRQVLEHDRARAAGETPEFEIDASFLPELKQARTAIGSVDSPRDVPIPLVLSILLAKLGESEGVDQLIELTRLDEALDPEHEYRVYAALTLASLGPDLAEAERQHAAAALVELFLSEDPGLALAAVAGVQRLPAEGVVPALRGILSARSLELRTTAALSLAALGDGSGVEVLRAALEPATYAAERELEPGRWSHALVSEGRRKALAALVALGRAPDPAELRRLGSEDPDPELRKAALECLAGSSRSGD